MFTRFKKTIEENKEVLTVAAIEGLVCAVTGAVTYSFLCKRAGYAMTKPSHYDDDFFYVRTVTGRILRSPKLPEPSAIVNAA